VKEISAEAGREANNTESSGGKYVLTRKGVRKRTVDVVRLDGREK